MKLAVPFNVHTLSSSQQKPFDACDTETLPSAMYQISIAQTCADMGEQQVLLNLVHQPSECSDFSGRLQAKAQNDMRGNLVQVPRGTLRPTLQGVAFPSRGFAEILRGRPAISVSSKVRGGSASRSYLLASRHLPNFNVTASAH